MAGTRNGFGVNETTDCYRTVKGEKYVGWGAGISAARIVAYRAAGVRCRRIADELYVRETDSPIAQTVDGQVGPNF
jgi:hypothetical protein